jgi:uncharacterized membrane protein
VSSPLEQAERAVAEVRRDVHEFFVLFAATVANEARAKVARLEGAVRHHDIEIVRTEGHQWSGEAGRAILQTADAIKEQP